MASIDREMERIINENSKHKGEWLTEDAVVYYQNEAKRCANEAGQDVRTKRRLRCELQEKYGLLEIEAINIMNGFNVSFYLKKYEQLRNCIPWGSMDVLEE